MELSVPPSGSGFACLLGDLGVNMMGQHVQSATEIQALKYSKELSTSIEDEARRLAVDAAKKRAAAQNADYPTFSALVSVAHLKPFERSRKRLDEQEARRTAPAWFFDAAGNFREATDIQGTLQGHFQVADFTHFSTVLNPHQCHDERSPSEGSDVSFIENPLFESNAINSLNNACNESNWRPKASLLQASRSSNFVGKMESRIVNGEAKNRGDACIHRTKFPPIMTSDTFQREWKRLEPSSNDRLLFLLEIPPHEFSHIFKIEVPPTILTDIVETLSAWKKFSTSSTLGYSYNLTDKCALDYAELVPLGDGEGKQKERLQQKGEPTARQGTTCSETAACNCLSHDHIFNAQHVLSVLASLTKCGRFPLSVKLMGERAHSLLVNLFDQLVDCLKEEGMQDYSALGMLENVCSMYIARKE